MSGRHSSLILAPSFLGRVGPAPTGEKAAVVLDDDVPKVHSDPKHDVASFWNSGVCGGHALLQLDGAVNGVDCATKLDQNAIPYRLKYSALMPSYKRLQNFLPPGLELSQRIGLILLH